ncbi:hypothetical protein AtNW77_Chr5g0098291 [Arabidopsis thaliana]|uniref:Methyltransferase-related protein n=4 Tax=Arabidopsis TaxID=3701 RepID=A0A178UDC9_ARATH|nr:methyltransferase-like protein [Arabidopsis thaliana]KAG7602254.1 hypothetical protein ISN45_At05g013400 [Arabidopsis thaliana x Arabidopsis arenosa]KAG7609201.1 hypothetical protein ISN44_As05g013360 [Arabidopsis suecica]AED92053.1 methyltransferase-like protein [Arabidopsis thaliana]OAO91254.1 hypothetical protein AXX17_AT5G14100 [Arabidopsis thaliana]CAA0402599.1 unnamed protein product [Arabidopsis thaliana]|eukprot:NP_001119225.1 methyltransferase-like protein [Arabidopsis thaliana]
MCPLRFVLVFFSAVLAGYIAWRTVNSTPELFSDELLQAEAKEKQGLDFKRKMDNGLWTFVDMASGRYLWRNLKEMRQRSQ